MEYYIGLTIILLIVTWFAWKISIIFSSNNGCPFHGVPSTEGMGEIPIPQKHEDKQGIQIDDKVTILPSNIKWLSEICGRIYKINDIEEKNGIKRYRLDYIFMWVTKDQIKKVKSGE
jgi:hypothetical protein